MYEDKYLFQSSKLVLESSADPWKSILTGIASTILHVYKVTSNKPSHIVM